jgi:hypothetical protein
MVTIRTYSFKINGVEVQPYTLAGTKIVRNRRAFEGNSAEIHLAQSVDDVITLSAGMSIVVSRGVTVATEDYIFKGNIKEIRLQDNIYVLICKDVLNQLKYLYKTISYDIDVDPEAGEPSAIFADLVTLSGLTPSVVPSGTGSSAILLDKFVSNNKSYLDRLDVLARILNWNFYYDYNTDFVRFEPKGYATYATPLIVGTNVYNFPDWKQDLEPMRNKITVEGANQIDTKIENFTGTGAQTAFQLTYTPQSTEVTVAGVLKVRGVPGITTTYDYYVDTQLKQIVFSVAPAGAAAIVVTYTALVPYPVVGKDPTSIATYGLTQAETYQFKDIVTVEDAETRMTQILSLLKDGIINTKLNTDEAPIIPGNIVSVQDPQRPTKDGDYIVFSVQTNYPEPFDVITIGNEILNISLLFSTINDRLAALEQSSQELATILRQVIVVQSTLPVQNRYFEKQKRDTTGDSIWGNALPDPWYWQGTYTNPLVETYHFPGNGIFEEYVYDNSYYDSSASSGVTWDTSAKTIAITAGGYMQTKRIAKGTAFSTVTVNLETFTGTITEVEMSFDSGATWQTIPLYIRTTVNTATTGDVYMKITATDAILLSNTYTTELDYSFPAFQIILEQ